MAINSDQPTLCECGCGEPAPIATRTRSEFGWIKGEPTRFIKGHNRKRINPDPEAEFWRHVEKADGCWLWRGSTVPFGYGRFWSNYIQYDAHRYAYTLLVGPIPDGLFVCHRCDNPACVNPAHLFVGTPQDNTLDMVVKGRHYDGNHFAGETNPSAKLTANDVLAIRDLAARRAMRQRDIAAKFGVSLALIEKIVARKVWSHI